MWRWNPKTDFPQRGVGSTAPRRGRFESHSSQAVGETTQAGTNGSATRATRVALLAGCRRNRPTPATRATQAEEPAHARDEGDSSGGTGPGRANGPRNVSSRACRRLSEDRRRRDTSGPAQILPPPAAVGAVPAPPCPRRRAGGHSPHSRATIVGVRGRWSESLRRVQLESPSLRACSSRLGRFSGSLRRVRPVSPTARHECNLSCPRCGPVRPVWATFSRTIGARRASRPDRAPCVGHTPAGASGILSMIRK